MPVVNIHQDFIQSAGKIPRDVYRGIPHFLNTLKTNPTNPGLNLHSLRETALDPRVHTARLNQAYRVVLLVEGDEYLVLHVDHHDDAIKWGRNKRFSLNANNGFQILEIPVELQNPNPNTETYNFTGIFDDFSDDLLFSAGVNREDIPIIRRIRSKEQLVEVCRYMDPLTASVLHLIADGVPINSAIEQSLSEIQTAETVQNENPQVTQNPQILSSGNVVQFNNDIDWNAIFSDNFENWRVFLHPAQQKIVNKSLEGALLIYGSAGTGKTVVLLHRAKKILESTLSGRILFMTFSINLGLEIRMLLDKLVGRISNTIEIYSIYDLAKKIISDQGWDGTVVSYKDTGFQNCWNDALQNVDSLSLNSQELLDEYLEVKELNGIYSREEYYNVTRKGKPRLHRQDREKIWTFFEIFESKLAQLGYITSESILHNARLVIERNLNKRYDHILVDEVQDMTIEALRFLRILSGITENKNHSLTLAGDTKQRIYRNQVSLSKAGIPVVGRSHRLKINYRTSEEIRKFATSLLNQLEIEELNDESSDTRGDYSAFRGPEPIITRVGSVEKGFEKLKSILDELELEGIQKNEICVTYRDELHDGFIEKMGILGIPTYELTYTRTDDTAYSGVRVGRIKRIKGLEFKVVILFLYQEEPILSNLNQLSLYDRCELYVASTRARERLWIIQ